jgi:hypothetical protein
MNRRALFTAGVLALGLLGLGAFAGREMRPESSGRGAAARVMPGTLYYAVEQGGEQIGFASSKVEVDGDRFSVADHLVADVIVGGERKRASIAISAQSSRPPMFDSFNAVLDAEAGTILASGRVLGDSALRLVIEMPDAPPDTQLIALSRAPVLPTMVPIALIMRGQPRVGQTTTLAVFDPILLGVGDVTFAVEAESLFVIADSASFAARERRHRITHSDTVRAWRIAGDRGMAGGFSGWIDARGRIVQAVQPGNLQMRRTAYELAYDAWHLHRGATPPGGTSDRDIMETTAIGASASVSQGSMSQLRVRLWNVSLEGYELEGERQRLAGDTLIVAREAASALRAPFRLPMATTTDRRRELVPEPLLQSDAPEIVALAHRIADGERDPAKVAERLTRWVHDSLEKRISLGVPNALQVLRSRSGDCNEHTQLFIALSRALGLPARGAAGLALLGGKFYYHAWPEVYLGQWVPVDPTFGQFPADAAHLRFVIGGLLRQADLLRLVGALQIEIVESE